MATLLKLFGRDPDDPVGSYLALDARQVRVIRGRVPRGFFRSRSDYVEAVLPDGPIQLVFRVDIRGFFPREFLLVHSPGQPTELRPIGEESNVPLSPSSVLATGPLAAVESFELSLYSVRDDTSNYRQRGRGLHPNRTYPFSFELDREYSSTVALADTLVETRSAGPGNSYVIPAISIEEGTPQGELFFLKRPQHSRPMVLGVWIPQTLANLVNRASVDYHVFLHPAAPDDRYYPRGHQTLALIQRYMLAYSEQMSDRMQLIHQHHIAGRDAVFVFPAGSPTSLRDVESAGGLWDVINRVHVELCRKMGAPHSLSRVGKIALSGWSYGVSRVGKILIDLRARHEHVLSEHLREVYLFDGPNSLNAERVDLGIERTRVMAKHWFNSSPAHVLRVYTQHDRWERLLIDESGGDPTSLGGPIANHQPIHNGYLRIHDSRLTLLIARNDIWLRARAIDHHTRVPRLRDARWPQNPEQLSAIPMNRNYDWVHEAICRYCVSHALRHSTLNSGS